MTYHLKRINPYWYSHPMIVVAAAIGIVGGLVGVKLTQPPLAILGGLMAGIAVIVAARPAITMVLGTLGFLGGLLTFILLPNAQAATMTAAQKLLATVLFSVFYTILMDALVLVAAVLYNFFGGVIGIGGIRLEFESDEEAPTEAA